jgi:hypothetical protein
MSSISCGIVGLPNVGKSTLFNALTDNNVLAANYPFATIEPNTGVVAVPDARLGRLSKMYNNAPVKPAIVTFVDIAGLVAGASKGEGLGNLFLSHIRNTNAVIHVVRSFADPDVQHVDSAPDPLRDIEIVNTELVLADLQTLNSRLPKLEKEAKANPKLVPLVAVLEEARSILDTGKPLFSAPDLTSRIGEYKELQLLTAKPIIYVFNVDEIQLGNSSQLEELKKLVRPAPALYICAKLEDQLRGLDEDDRLELLASYEQSESGLMQLIKTAYNTLGLQSFLTAGATEVRAWTIPAGATAPQAAGVIHSDFQHGFIAAEVVDYEDLIKAGSLPAARAAGKVRTEGKTYIMQPNDVVEFRFNT